MSLASRLSAFFLVALVLVLAGFSATLYGLARTYLIRQLDERLELALDTLEASVDIEPGGLEWEPTDRQMSLGVDPGVSAVRWVVRDGNGNPVDRSKNTSNREFPASWGPESWPTNPSDGTVFANRPGWRVAGRRLWITDLLKQGRGSPDDQPGFETQYPVLILVVGLAPAPVEAALSRLGLTLFGLSTVVWVFAALMGRWLCIRALNPVSRMAKVATEMTESDWGSRLPVPKTGDELEELGTAFNDLLDRLNGAFRRLNESHEEQRRFAGEASHQLRTPLTALLGQVQVARRRDRSPEEYRRVLDLVQTEANRLRQIIDSLLSLVQHDGTRPKLQVVDLRDWLADHMARWSTHERFPDLQNETTANSSLPVLFQPSLLAQLVDNLLENATKYSRAGTPIVVQVWSVEASACLGVEDRGCGLSAEDQSRVFQPFFRAERSKNEGLGGVGLGLAVAQRIARSFGGSLSVQSTPGSGCLFVLQLPLALGRLSATSEANDVTVAAQSLV